MFMKSVPMEYLSACESAGKVEKLTYRDKFLLLYTPTKPAKRILYLIHGGGGDLLIVNRDDQSTIGINRDVVHAIHLFEPAFAQGG